MPREFINLHELAHGRAQLGYAVNNRPNHRIVRGEWTKNRVMEDAATIIAKLLSGQGDGKSYKISAFYLEYQNNGGAAVSVPDDEDIDRSQGIEYYQGLAGNRDYLRVPITAGLVQSTDADQFPGGNKTVFYGQSSGVTGVNGLPFNDGVDSRVYGAALVATPQFADDTQDLVFARVYFSSSHQLIKIVGSQISITWEHVYG